MKNCSKNHEEVQYASASCPVCDREDDIERLQEHIDRLNDELDEAHDSLREHESDW